MSFSKCPSKEEIELLEELSVGTDLRESNVLTEVPNWAVLRELNIISSTTCLLLNELPSLSFLECVHKVESTPELYAFPLLLLEKTSTEISMIRYTLTLYYDIVRSDTSVLDKMLTCVEGEKTLEVFKRFCEKQDVETFLVDKVVFLLSSLIARANADVFPDTRSLEIVNNIIQGNWKLSSYGRLDSLKNIMKEGRFRGYVWQHTQAQEIILSHLDSSKNIVYPAAFCAWVSTFDDSILSLFMKLGGLEKICTILRHCKTEKVVRVCIRVLLNCLSNEESIEALINQNVVQVLTLLEYEKWRDEELYTEIRNVLCALQQKIKLLSNFERYCRELDSRKLHWSFLHSDKFWRENFIHFEENEFIAVKKLTLLLRSDDPVTAAIACFDIGEFARLHPMGKKVIQKIKAKEIIIFLMSHKNRDVSREALLCVQKIMLDHWQKAIGA